MEAVRVVCVNPEVSLAEVRKALEEKFGPFEKAHFRQDAFELDSISVQKIDTDGQDALLFIGPMDICEAVIPAEYYVMMDNAEAK